MRINILHIVSIVCKIALKPYNYKIVNVACIINVNYILYYFVLIPSKKSSLKIRSCFNVNL
jgi:hypothetical protein